MMKIVLATRNRGKYREIAELIKDSPLTPVPLWNYPDVLCADEDQPTFRLNALKKGREIYSQLKRPVLADDSGLVVDGLEGRPGVLSARYAGREATDDENLEKLLKEIQRVPESGRSARYVCVLALILGEGKEVVVEENCEGVITTQARGHGGFGYDPIFFLPPLGKTMAELPPDHKNRLSHRGKAIRRLLEILPSVLGRPGERGV